MADNNKGRSAHGRRRKGRSPGRGSRKQPVPLHKRAGSHFQTGDRKRGRDYFLEGRVRLEVEGSRVRARVEGQERRFYAVGIDWSRVGSDRALHVFCGCQRFAQGHPCKHVWATLLALDDSTPHSQPPGGDRLKLRRDRADSWEELGQPAGTEGPVAGRRSVGARASSRGAGTGRRSSPGSWRSQLATLRKEVEGLSVSADETTSNDAVERGIRLLVNTRATLDTGGLVLDVFAGKPEDRDDLAKLRPASLDAEELEPLVGPGTANGDSAKRPAIVIALPPETPGRKGRGRRAKGGKHDHRIRRIRLPERLYGSVLPHLSAEGTLGWWDGRTRSDRHPLTWDDGPPWRLALRLDAGGGTVRLHGALERDGESRPLTAPELVLPAPDDPEAGGTALVLFPDCLARLADARERDLLWLALLRDVGEIAIPKKDLEEALTSLLELSGLPPLEAPEELQLAVEHSAPQPRLFLEPDPSSAIPNPPLVADLSFDYGEVRVGAQDTRPSVIDWDQRTFLQRDMEAERDALVRLVEAGLRPEASGHGKGLELPPRELPGVAETLLGEGWIVEVRGTSLRPPSPPALRIESGIDWFELRGEVDFDGDRVELRKVLEAVSRGDRFVTLGDGSQGLLPASWMETYGSLSELAHDASEEGLLFLPSQALFVDALLTAMPAPDVDREFGELREKLRSFDRIKPKKEPRSFDGTLRSYQREGLGWLTFLRDFGLGGVLADDMGLGKTVQVLALLRAHRTKSKTTGLPSLVVAPRSLVYNWIDEAKRFTPDLEVVEYHGADREELHGELGGYDLVVTTYGTLRRDIGFLATVEFDTVVLDEAQAIKNPESQTAKASRLLDGRNRLALTGTPIENHLGELGSILDFLNPGLLGRLPKLDVLVSGGAPSRGQLELVAQGVRPFILRRTKAQVLKDLPPKTEQVLFCSLRERQRELYDQLRAGYQVSLLEQVEAKGISGSTMQVLEALLRLRQIACHPGLVNDDWEEAGSAKLEALFEQVYEVLDEGHKAIVFSQFTSLLAYVRKELDDEEVPYAYLDGQTRNRGEVVDRFQTDPSCNLILISLKAGGLGLNLTAAGYVFLLDPWWNPAVEAQAIDRAHRIGQTQPVFAYRLIARDTVEEKILDLQRSKRQLAEAVLEGEGKPLSDLTAEDLRMLLS